MQLRRVHNLEPFKVVTYVACYSFKSLFGRDVHMRPVAGADKGGNVTVLFSLSWATVNFGQQTRLAYFFSPPGDFGQAFY